MKITVTDSLNTLQKEVIFGLWNQEYPAQVMFENMDALDVYLGVLQNQLHYFVSDDNNSITGWAFLFERDSEKWFAMILNNTVQGKGLGTSLLNILKSQEELLNGWVIDHDRYLKQNGEKYISPISFYLKNNFTVCSEIRLETESLSAVKIKWHANK